MLEETASQYPKVQCDDIKCFAYKTHQRSFFQWAVQYIYYNYSK